MKNQFLNLRVDTDTKRHLKQTAQNLHLTESDFIRKAIWEFESLLEGAAQSLHRQERLTQLETTLKQLRRQLEAYEKEASLKALFAAHKGQTIDGKLIAHPVDLVGLLAENAQITLVEPDSLTQEATLEADSLVLQAQPATESPTTSAEFLPAANELPRWKRYGLFLLGLLTTGVLFLLVRRQLKRRKKAQPAPSPAQHWQPAALSTHL